MKDTTNYNNATKNTYIKSPQTTLQMKKDLN